MIVINFDKWNSAILNKSRNRYFYKRIYFRGIRTPLVKRELVCILPRKWRVRGWEV